MFHRVLLFMVVIMVDISTRTTKIPLPNGAISSLIRFSQFINKTRIHFKVIFVANCVAHAIAKVIDFDKIKTTIVRLALFLLVT